MSRADRAAKAHQAILDLVLPAIQEAARRAGLSPEDIAGELLCLAAQDTALLEGLSDLEVAREADLDREAVAVFFEERLDWLQELDDIQQSQDEEV